MISYYLEGEKMKSCQVIRVWPAHHPKSDDAQVRLWLLDKTSFFLQLSFPLTTFVWC